MSNDIQIIEGWELNISTGERSCKNAGIFTSEKLAIKAGKGGGWYGVDGTVHPVYLVKLGNGKLLKLYSKEQHVLVCSIKEYPGSLDQQARNAALKKLTAKEKRLLRL